MRNTMLKYVLIACFSVISGLEAQTQFASIFGDHMVLQRNTNIKVWGTDTPNTVVLITASWGVEAKVKTDANGKWSSTLKTTKAGGPYVLEAKGSRNVALKDILLGEVWLCGGQSNMAMKLKGGPGQHIDGSNNMILNSTNSNLRFFTVQRAVSETPLDSCVGEWQVSQPKTAAKFSAVGYAFGLRLQKYLGVPVGLISSNVGGTPAQAWTSKETITSEFPEFNKDFSKKINTKSATVLYNGMIHPLMPYTIKGAIWYQGEANRWNPEQYSRLFPAMINNWRTNWSQGDFPFYFVQLAPYGNKLEGWVGVQQAQLKTMLELKNTGMVVINDIGYKTRIHPPEKIIVGERLALWALAKDYAVEGIVYSGPTFKSLEIKGNKASVFFDNAPDGITSMGKPLTDFEIAGADGVYYSAEVKIPHKGASLQVWSDKVSQPKNVRYAWKSYVDGCLYNTAGLPASAFCSENWNAIFKK